MQSGMALTLAAMRFLALSRADGFHSRMIAALAWVRNYKPLPQEISWLARRLNGRGLAVIIKSRSEVANARDPAGRIVRGPAAPAGFNIPLMRPTSFAIAEFGRQGRTGESRPLGGLGVTGPWRADHEPAWSWRSALSAVTERRGKVAFGAGALVPSAYGFAPQPAVTFAPYERFTPTDGVMGAGPRRLAFRVAPDSRSRSQSFAPVRAGSNALWRTVSDSGNSMGTATHERYKNAPALLNDRQFAQNLEAIFYRQSRLPPNGATGFDDRLSPAWPGLKIPL